MNTLFEGKTVAELAAFVGGRVVGDGGERQIRQVASLESAGEGDIAFVEDVKFFERARQSKASCVIVPEGARLFADQETALTARDSACVIEVRQPKLAFALIAGTLHPPQRGVGAIHPTAQVDATATVDESALIGPYVHIGARAQVGAGTQILNGAFIGEEARLGRDCLIHPHVTLYARITLGDRVILHAGVVIGADGFGYVRSADGYTKFPQIGTVVIEDDVEIGAHTCVDRGALGVTRIGRGTKIDNLVQVAHNVTIGEHVVIAAQTGISGSTVIEDEAVIGGQVGMGDHARVGRGAIVGSKAGILPGKMVRPGAIVWGVPVRPLDEYKRLNAHFGRLPQMRAEIDALRKLVQELQARLDEKRLDSGG